MVRLPVPHHDSSGRTASPAAHPPPGEPALHRAARVGDHDKIRDLIGGGGQPDAVFTLQPDNRGAPIRLSPLMVAAGSGEGATVETVRLLLELGASPGHVLDRRSAATVACLGLGGDYPPGGDVERLQVLLAAGSPLKVTGESGNLAACTVAARGDAAMLGELLDRGADPNGYWSEELARRRQAGIEASFMKHFTVVDEEACRELVAELQTMGAGPLATDIPLFCAARGGSVECVRLLIERGASVTRRDLAGETALWHAGTAPIARELLAHGLSLNDRSKGGFTPLVGAILSGPDAMSTVSALVEAGADVNERVHDGSTPLMCAVACDARDRGILETLVAAGADPLAVTGDGATILHEAITGAWDDPDAGSILGYLHALGADVNRPDHHGVTPLAHAIADGSVTEMKALIELGADVNARGPRDLWDPMPGPAPEVPLVFLSMFGDDGDARLESMLAAGAELDVTDDRGRSPLEFARTLYAAADAEEGFDDALNTSYIAISRCVELLESITP